MSSGVATLNRTPLIRPGRALDWYPEKRSDDSDAALDWVRRQADRMRLRRLGFARFADVANQIDASINRLRALPTTGRKAELAELREAFDRDGFSATPVIDAMAHAGTFVKDRYGFWLHREQYYCVWLLLNGVLAEMATGEGKSITAGVTASIGALAGLPVHVITTNDYLVARDAESARPLFDYFGLTSGYVTPELGDDERRAAYRNDVCYVSNKQLVFDYLKDRRSFGQRPSSVSSRTRSLVCGESKAPFMRGLSFAIVDEADSVLIDDAITPLILSQQVDGDDNVTQSITAMSLARRMTEGEDFFVESRFRRISISEDGEYKLATMASSLDGVWKNKRFRQELARQALAAIHLFVRDRDYIVRNDEVQLIDQSTGRVMPDRKLQHGLHQMVETKEKCELSGRTETLSSLSFQRFFTRYHHLCGMSGTVAESAKELGRVYGLSVMPVPTHQPTARVSSPPVIAKNRAGQHAALLEEIGRCNREGRPVLIGTRSVVESESLSELLCDERISHRVLNARQDEQEADVVAKAGRLGAVTIATNMAGRGTDIPLDYQARELGGLKVIVAELNDNRRIDRQLIGRSARQGDPGGYVYILSLEDDLLQRLLPMSLRRLLASRWMLTNRPGRLLAFGLCRLAQALNERANRKMRRNAAKADVRTNARLSFVNAKE